MIVVEIPFLNIHPSTYIFVLFSCIIEQSRNPLRCNAVTRFELNRIIPMLQRKQYTKTMKELEMILGVPPDVSIFG